MKTPSKGVSVPSALTCIALNKASFIVTFFNGRANSLVPLFSLIAPSIF
jgi:hypothetical protein